MITEMELHRFKGFEHHTIPFRPLTVVVGRNNAGKSSVVEALRLVSSAIARAATSEYKEAPDWTRLPRFQKGVALYLRRSGIDLTTAVYQYGSPPAIVIARFDNGSSVEVYVRSEPAALAVIRNSEGRPAQGKAAGRRAELPQVFAMPQVAPLQRDERVLVDEYVKRSLETTLSPRHFRNQLRLFPPLYKEFCAFVERTWSGVRVQDLFTEGALDEASVHLHVRCDDFVAEASELGHGLQVWLQIMWFLVRARDATTVILDEPDVYLHADLQRHLMGLLRRRYQQVILTSHSAELLAEASADEILVVDKRRSESGFADTLPAVQAIADGMGSAQNVSLARVWYARRLLLVEGEDIGILKHFHRTLFRDSGFSLDALPRQEFGGWGRWQYVVGSHESLRNAFGESITTFCLLDSDYHSVAALQERYAAAAERGIQLHIWLRKELENYLLCPSAIARLICRRAKLPDEEPVCKAVSRQIETGAERLRHDTLQLVAEDLRQSHRDWGIPCAMEQARQALAEREQLAGSLAFCVGGKELFSELRTWSKTNYGVSFGLARVAQEMRPEEIPDEVVSVIEAIESCIPFKEKADWPRTS